jgi:hypothetical protein
MPKPLTGNTRCSARGTQRGARVPRRRFRIAFHLAAPLEGRFMKSSATGRGESTTRSRETFQLPARQLTPSAFERAAHRQAIRPRRSHPKETLMRVASKATLWSTAALLSLSVWRATTLLLSDISAEWTADAVDAYAGKTAHWTILALISLGYLLHTLRGKRNSSRKRRASSACAPPRRSRRKPFTLRAGPPRRSSRAPRPRSC